MWGAIIQGVSTIFGGWIETKKAKYEAEASLHMARAKAEADWDTEALRQAQFSWKDEFITLVWFAPLIVAWLDPEQAMQWIEFVNGLPYWYQIVMFGIVAASFGLRWLFKDKLVKAVESKS